MRSSCRTPRERSRLGACLVCYGAVVNDQVAPVFGSETPQGDFKTYGVRVPLLVLSPYAKPHFVSHAVYDHTSITRFIETRWRLPALTRRDANADPLLDLFDFKKATFATPPQMPVAPVDPAKQAECAQLFPITDMKPSNDFGP